MQQDILYDLLDCYEHLELYAILKNVPNCQINKKVILTKLFLVFFIRLLFLNINRLMKFWIKLD